MKERDEERREGEEERRSGYVKERRRREGEEEKWGCEREGGEKRGRRGERCREKRGTSIIIRFHSTAHRKH